MNWLWLVILSPLWGAGLVVGTSFLLAWLVFPAGGSRGPHDTPTSRLVGTVLVLLGEWLAATWVAATMVFRWVGRRRLGRVTGNRRPLVLLPGFLENPITLWPLRVRLARALGVPVVVLRPPPYGLELSRQARQVAGEIAAVLEETGAAKVDIVGHSLGGLLARHLVEIDGLGDRIDTVVTLATPHLGSALAALVPLRAMHQMRRGSAYLETLNNRPLPGEVRFVGICSTHDNLVLPWNCSLSPRGDNFILRYQGHTTLLFSRQVVAIIARELGS